MTSPKATIQASTETAETYTTGSGAPAASPRSLEEALGVQIRKLRHEQDLTIAELAHAASISLSLLSKIENGQASPSLTTLQALAESLNVPITGLFSAFEEKRDCSYVQAGQGVIINRRGTKVGHKYQLLGHALSGGVVVEPFLITLSEEAVPYTGFQHAGTELIYMLSGEVSYRHGDKSYHLRPGDMLMFDSGSLHGPEDLIIRPMTYLSIIIYAKS
jgi:transcriptional regulator with XRE-family HTH domain